jgi:hypothetical protein
MLHGSSNCHAPDDLMNSEAPVDWVDAIVDLDHRLGNDKAPGIYDLLSLDKLREIYTRRRDILDDPESDETPEALPPSPKPTRSDTGGGQKRRSAVSKGRAIKTGTGKFRMAPEDAIMDARLSHFDLRLALLLDILCGMKGFCWWAEKRLATMIPGTNGRTGVSVKTIQRSLDNLDKCDLIDVLAPEQSAAQGYDTGNAPTNTIVLKWKRKYKVAAFG